jgi:hypothetical protein
VAELRALAGRYADSHGRGAAMWAHVTKLLQVSDG